MAQEHLSSPERQQRRELEYEEADEPNPVFEQILEAAVQIPNIPLPKSSDGNVSTQSVLGGRTVLITFVALGYPHAQLRQDGL